MKSGRRGMRRGSPLLGIAMATPAVILLFLFLIWPIFVSAQYSVTSASGYGDLDPVGAENFIRAVQDEKLYAAFGRNIVFAAVVVLASVFIGFLVSYLLFIKVRGWRALQIVLMVPYIMPVVVTALLWQFMLEPENGLINSSLRSVGLGFLANPWLSSESTALASVSFVQIWVTIPFAMLLIFGAMLSLPAEVIEAAELDGANHWSRMSRVVLPMVWPTIVLVMFVLTVTLFRSFDMIYLLTKGGPINSTTIATLYVFVQGFVNNNYGYANALGLVVAVVLIALALVPQIISRRRRRATTNVKESNA